MQTYRFIDLDGVTIYEARATSAAIACNMFLRDKPQVLARSSNPPDDIVCQMGGRVVAVLSERGNHRPDVMILEHMRQRILQQAS